MNGDTSIIGLALSSPAYLWVYYTATDTSQQLARINLDNLTDHTSTQVMVGLTTLVQLKANDGVALLGPVRSPALEQSNNGTLMTISGNPMPERDLWLLRRGVLKY